MKKKQSNKRNNNKYKVEPMEVQFGFIEEKEVRKVTTAPPRRNKNAKRDGYSKRNQGHFDKEKFVQATMKFVLKNP